jgi:IclR family mhp operon transcriptional activator
MVIRETTHGRTELFVHKVGVGTRSPMLTTAMGRAYLAHCSDDEREQTLERVAASDAPEAPLARDAAYVRRIVETTREAGYGLSFGDAKAALGSVALPIRAQGRVVAGLNVVFFTGVVGRPMAVRKFLPALTRAAGAIERKLAQAA